MDKLRAFSVFKRVVEVGSFKGAAEDLELSKAAISKNILELEEHLKTPLIVRTTRTMHVTQKGQQFYDHVRGVLDEIKNVENDFQQVTDGLTGLLKISVPMSVGLTVINPAVIEFMKLYPEITIDMVLSDNLVDIVDQGFDLAIRGSGALDDSSLKTRKLFDLDRCVCASPSYLQNHKSISQPIDIADHNSLIFSLLTSKNSWQFISIKNPADKILINLNQIKYSANNSLALKQACISGLGVLLIPKILVKEELASGQLKPILQDWQFDQQAVYAMYPFHKEATKKVRLFIDFLVDYFER